MKLKDFPILADENIFRILVNHLRTKQFDIVSVRELNIQGTMDTEILALAAEEGRVVLTQDNDFGKMVFTNEINFTGIIYLRPGHFPPERHIATLDAILNNDSLELFPPFVLTVEQRDSAIFRMRLRNRIYG